MGDYVQVTVVYDTGMDDRVIEILDTLRVSGWTKVSEAQGFGGAGRKLNTPVFPGQVNMLWIVLPTAEVAPLVEALRALQATYRRNPGLTLWTTPAMLY